MCVGRKKESRLEQEGKLLLKLLQKHKSKKSPFDCIVAVSGGKDGSYVAHNLKTKYKMNPLTVTIRPITETPIGVKNLSNFIQSGFNNI